MRRKQAPFGAVRVSPDTAFDGVRIPFDNFGGYNYADAQVLAFSHTHMVGAGVADLGAIGLMPFPAPLTGALALLGVCVEGRPCCVSSVSFSPHSLANNTVRTSLTQPTF